MRLLICLCVGPPATRNAVLALIRYKCVLGRALLEESLQTNNMNKDFGSDIQHLQLPSGIQRGGGSVKTGGRSKGLETMATWEMWEMSSSRVNYLERSFTKKAESWIPTALIKSVKGRVNSVVPKNSEKHSDYDSNGKINAPFLTALAPALPGRGPVTYRSVSVNVRKFYWVRWNAVLFTIKTGFGGRWLARRTANCVPFHW